MTTNLSLNQIVFIDSAVADPATLIAGLNPGIEVVMLQAGSDGLGQIDAALAGRSDLDALHIYSHGSAGLITLGSIRLSSANLEQFQSTLRDIGSHLSANADILLYGCDVAQGDSGQSFIAQLAQLTGADVAASTDLTGAASLGGDWVLEAESGAVNVASVAATGWGHALSIASTSPSDNATNVSAATVSLAITFTGVAELAWNSGAKFYLYTGAGTLVESFSWPNGSGVYSGTGTLGGNISAPGNPSSSRVITITPGQALVAGQSYYIITDASAYYETGTLGQITDPTTWNFTVAGGDTTPPTFDVAPAAGSLSTSGFTPSASLNESGTLYYAVVASGETAPSVAQVKLGQNASSAAALASGNSAAITGNFDASFSAISSLSSNTAYDVYFVAKDAANNDQTSVTKVVVTTAATTAAPTPPVLDASKSPTLGTTAANLSAPSNSSTANSVLVSSLIDSVNGAGLDNYSDANSDAAGIAITGVNSNGTLYYSTDAGTNWSQLSGTVSATSALALHADANTRVYFQPSTGFTGSLTDAITFKAWDRTGSFSNGQSGVNTSTDPVLAGTYNGVNSPWGMAAYGNHAYVGNGSQLQVLVIANSYLGTGILSHGNGSRYVTGVAISGDGAYAYVTGQYTGLQVFSLSNPASPQQVGSLLNTMSAATGVAVSGHYAYVADRFAGLQIYDISNPRSLGLVSSHNNNISGPNDVAISGHYLYVTLDVGGLQILDITNPTRLTFAGGYSNFGSVAGVAVSGHYAYVGDRNSGLKVLDISDPLHVTQVGSYPSSTLNSVAVYGDKIYLLGSNGIQILNQFDPSTGSFSTASDSVDVQVLANTAPSATAVNLPFTDTPAADTLSNATGTLTFTDAENNSFTLSLSGSSTGANHTVGGIIYDLSKTSHYGTLYLVSTPGADKGKYLFVQDDAAINKLASSTSVDFVVNATDSGSPAATGQTTIKVSITGANDAPVLAAPAAIGIVDTADVDTQAGLIKASSNNSGTMSASDAENGALAYGINSGTNGGSTVVNGISYDVSKVGTNGTLYVNSSTGAYAFVPAANAVNALAAGNTSETFTVTASDGSATSSQTLTVNYTGANDTPVMTSSNPPIALKYVDTVALDFFSNQPNPLTALTGTDAEGAVTYGISGGTGGSSVVAGVTYDVSQAGSYGTLYLHSTGADAGKYVYVPDSAAINALLGGANKTDLFTLTITDAAAGSVSTTLEVQVVGADDVPVIERAGIKIKDTVVADTFANQTGNLRAFDVDHSGATNNALTYGITGSTVGATVNAVVYDISSAGTYGTLYVKSTDGAYVYIPNATAINALSASTTDSFTISASDGASTPGIGTSTFTAIIGAVNDAPVLTAPTVINLADTAATDSFGNQTGTLSATDAEGTALTYTARGAATGGSDNIGGITYDLKLAGNYGTLYLVSSDASNMGKYVYMPDATKINALTANSSDTFGVGSSDGNLTATSPLTINLSGVNDTPVLASVTALSYTDTTAQDIFPNQGGQLSGSDADNNAQLSYGISTGTGSGNTVIGGVSYDVSKVGTYGTLYVASSSAAYQYVPNGSAMESLKSGNGTDTFTVSLTDGVISNPVTQTLTVNLTGANDPTSTSGDSTGMMTEDDTNAATGRVVISDRDTVDAIITTQTSTAGTYGSFSVDATGQWSFSLNNSANVVQALAKGISVTDTFAIVANGVSNNVVITVNGANDAPTSTNSSVTTNQNQAWILTAADFGTYADPEGTALNAVNITTAPALGTLEFYDGTAWATLTQTTVSAVDLANNLLRYLPAAGGSGIAYTTMDFKVSDDIEFSAATYTLTVNVTANTAPTIAGIPGTTQGVTAGTAAALADFTVADAEQGATSLSVTLTATNGVINGLSDADTTTAGIQLTGTAAVINTALAAATFTANAAGAASMGISVSDGVVTSPTTGTYNLTASGSVIAQINALDPAGLAALTNTYVESIFASNDAAALDQLSATAINVLVSKLTAAQYQTYKATLAIVYSSAELIANLGAAPLAGLNALPTALLEDTLNNRLTGAQLATVGGPRLAVLFNGLAINFDNIADAKLIDFLNNAPAGTLPLLSLSKAQTLLSTLASTSTLNADALAGLVAAANTAPTIAGIPGTTAGVTAGTAAALADFTVADTEQGATSLSVTLTATNGVINGLSDADTNLAGIQLTGTAAVINMAVAAATFTANAAGAASMGISVSDGIVSTPTTATYNLSATNPNTAPAPIPDPGPTPAPATPTPVTTPTPTPTADTDGVPDAQENAAPGLAPVGGGTALAGDGNGDGVVDSQQAAVASVAFLNTPTAHANPANAASVYVSLVADSINGKVDATKPTPTALTDVRQLDAPANLPSGIKMPLGLIAFSAILPTAGITESFSLYVDPSVDVNGYWKLNTAGTWVNLASAAYGGQIVTEGGKTRLDFTITDGGQFDADTKADGVITDPGAAGSMPLSLVGYAPELAAGTHFWF